MLAYNGNREGHFDSAGASCNRIGERLLSEAAAGRGVGCVRAFQTHIVLFRVAAYCRSFSAADRVVDAAPRGAWSDCRGNYKGRAVPYAAETLFSWHGGDRIVDGRCICAN